MATTVVEGRTSPAVGVRSAETDIVIGTMAAQDANAVAITGGRVDGAVVPVYPRAAGAVAAGTTQADALVITAGATEFATVAAGAGAKLPVGDPGAPAWIFNGGANALLVYPFLGGQIDALGANAAFSVAAGKGLLLMPMSTTQWYSLKGA
jgi:hypothetical protein